MRKNIAQNVREMRACEESGELTGEIAIYMQSRCGNALPKPGRGGRRAAGAQRQKGVRFHRLYGCCVSACAGFGLLQILC